MPGCFHVLVLLLVSMSFLIHIQSSFVLELACILTSIMLAMSQKKEMLLAKLRKELVIPDQRHEALRAMIEDGRELRERYTLLHYHFLLFQPFVPNLKLLDLLFSRVIW